MKKGITVIVCTYNGALRLPETLAHLAAQSFNQDISWEIIVVDNDSTDDSAIIARETWEKYRVSDNVPFRVIREIRQGKIYALEQAFSLAEFEYSIICDDDNWLDKNYVERMYTILEDHPEAGAAGGDGIAVSENGKFPEWFQDFEEGYAVGKQGTDAGDISSRGHLWGAGMGTSTKLYQQMYLNFPSLLVGRMGGKLTAGEDSEYCQRLLLKGYTLYYDPSLRFRHYMPLARLDLAYKAKLFDGFKEGNKILDKYYLANRIRNKIHQKPLKKISLLFLSPFRILISATDKKDRELDVFTLLTPLNIRQNSVMGQIKRFINANITSV